jgi:hypothetical protein
MELFFLRSTIVHLLRARYASVASKIFPLVSGNLSAQALLQATCPRIDRKTDLLRALKLLLYPFRSVLIALWYANKPGR